MGNYNFEIEVRGKLGRYKRSGFVKIRPQDIINALDCYFVELTDEKNLHALTL